MENKVKEEKKVVEEEEKETIGSKILDVFVDIVTVFLIIFSLFVLVTSLTAKANNGVPELFGHSYLRVQTNSMQGTINKGDLIIVKEVVFDPTATKDIDEDHKNVPLCAPNIEFKENETILAFYYDVNNDGRKEVVTHLLIEIKNNGFQYVLQGTYREGSETLAKQTVSYSDIVGYYTGIRIPYLGGFFSFLFDTPMAYGFILCVMTPIGIVFFFKLYKLILAIMEARQDAKVEALQIAAAQNVDPNKVAEEKARLRAELLKEMGLTEEEFSKAKGQQESSKK